MSVHKQFELVLFCVRSTYERPPLPGVPDTMYIAVPPVAGLKEESVGIAFNRGLL
jgi:hypothetical protein